MAKTKDALDIIDRITGNDPELRGLIDEETINAHVARMVYEARTKAGLTQQELAERVGIKQPVIARLEDADYEGHSLQCFSVLLQPSIRNLRFTSCQRLRRPPTPDALCPKRLTQVALKPPIGLAMLLCAAIPPHCVPPYSECASIEAYKRSRGRTDHPQGALRSPHGLGGPAKLRLARRIG